MRIGSLTNFIFLTNEADKQFKNLSKLIRTLGTGKRVDLFEASPSGVYESETLKRKIAKLELYEDNIKLAKGLLLTVDDLLGKVYDTVLTVKEKLVQAANSQSDYEALKAELTELKNRLLQYAQTKVGDYYLFAGNTPTTQPFDTATYDYNGGSSPFKVQVSDNDFVPTFVVGSEVFGSGANSIFKKIDDLINNIEDKTAVEQGIADMEAFLKQIDRVRAYVGSNEAKLAEYELTYSNMLDNLKKRLSEITDADIASATTEYQRVQVAYQTLLTLLGNQNSQSSPLLKYF